MKAERRHELETNSLADWIGHHLPWISTRANTILGLLAAGLAAVVLLWIVQGRTGRLEASAWDAFYGASFDNSLGALDEVAQQNAGTTAGSWAALMAADSALSTAVDLMLTDRQQAMTRVKESRDAYIKLLDTNPPTEVAQRAKLGAAQADETAGDLKRAAQHYREIVETWPNTVASSVANARLAFVNQPSTAAFVEWFAEQGPMRPKPAADPLGSGAVPGIAPPTTSSSPAEPAIPNVEPPKDPASDTPASDTPASDGSG